VTVPISNMDGKGYQRGKCKKKKREKSYNKKKKKKKKGCISIGVTLVSLGKRETWGERIKGPKEMGASQLKLYYNPEHLPYGF